MEYVLNDLIIKVILIVGFNVWFLYGYIFDGYFVFLI